MKTPHSLGGRAAGPGRKAGVNLRPARRTDNRLMDDVELPPDRLASVFAGFVRQVAAAAAGESSPLLARIRAHLGADLARQPVIVEQFDTFEQPNLQVALDAYVAGEGRGVDLLGVSMENKRFMAVGLSELATWGGGLVPRPPLVEGPVDFVNLHLAGGRVLACVQFGLYLVRDGDARLAALVTGPSEMGDPRRQKLRLEVMSGSPEDARAFIAKVRELMTRLNVYRGDRPACRLVSPGSEPSCAETSRIAAQLAGPRGGARARRSPGSAEQQVQACAPRFDPPHRLASRPHAAVMRVVCSLAHDVACTRKSTRVSLNAGRDPLTAATRSHP